MTDKQKLAVIIVMLVLAVACAIIATALNLGDALAGIYLTTE